MTRKKVKLVWIVNDGARKASLKKRRIGLLKKVSELTTLCGVAAFAIIYSPDEGEPMIWPSRPAVEQMLMRFQSIPEIGRSKKMMNQESYLKERMGKLQDQSRKNAKKNGELEMSYLMDKLHHHENGADGFQFTELQSLVWLLEERMRDIRRRVDHFQHAPSLDPPGSFLEPTLAPPMLLPPPPPPQEMGREGGGPNDAMAWDQWFFDMMNNSGNVAGGSGSGGARNEHVMMAAPPSPAPHGYNFSGFHGGEMDGGILGLGPPSGAGNVFDLGMGPHHANPNPNFGLAFPIHHVDFLGSSSGNPMGFGLLPPPGSVPGSSGRPEEGLRGFLGGGNDMGPQWAPNISP